MERLNTNDLRKIEEAAGTYAGVFAGPEWDEVSRCPIGDKFYGREYPPGSIGPCKKCNGVILEQAYPLEKTSKYILKEISSKNAIAYTYTEDNKILAFGWGFELSGTKFAEGKYKKENWKFIRNLVGININYFYVSEIGVIPELQGRKVGGQITRMVAEKGNELGLPLLLRTINTSSMAYTAANMGMQLVMGGDLPDNLKYLKNNSLRVDPENSNRLLFIKTK